MKELKDVIGDYELFLDKIFFMIDDIELDVFNLELDHLCYRVATVEEYELKKNELTDLGDLLIESMVNGRLISTYKLQNPILYRNREIHLVELPSPKESHSYSTGLEHIEFVTKEPLVKIVNRYPQFAFETFGMNKKINPDITLKLGDFCIRFHNQNLADVIKGEKKPDFNNQSRVPRQNRKGPPNNNFNKNKNRDNGRRQKHY
jgi:predicted metalloenzyme YecM